MKPGILLLISLFVVHKLQAQNKHSDHHDLSPGLSIGYLPTWLLDDYDGNTTGKTYMIGIHAYKEIWKESVFSIGIVRGKLDVKNETKHAGIIMPIKLQKYFNPDRAGFNLSFGYLMNYCKTCSSQIEGALSYEVGYLIPGHLIQVNIGIQFIEGFLYDDYSIHLGGQVQLIWHPEEQRRNK